MRLPAVALFDFNFFELLPIRIEVSAALLTSNAGVLSLRQFDERIGLTKQFAAVLDDPRDPELTEHTFLEMVRSRVFGILAGYEDQNDHDALRTDPVFKLIADRSPEEDDLASQPTLSRFENQINIASLKLLRKVFVEQFIASFAEPPLLLTFDLDAVDDPTHESQQLTLFHAFYEQYQYLPLVITSAETEQVVMLSLRHGTAAASLEADDDLEYLVTRVRAAWPNVRIRVHGEGGFGNPTMYKVSERLDDFHSPEQGSWGAAMRKSRLLRLGEVRAALRLVGECRDLGYDPALWMQRAFEGLCGLVGARAGNGGEVRLTRPHGPLQGASYSDAGLEPWEHDLYAAFLRTHGIDRHPIAGGFDGRRMATPRPGRLDVRTRRQLVTDREWYGSVAYNVCHRAIRIDHCLASLLERTADGWFSCIILHRATGEPDFAPCQQQLLYLFHDELGRLIGPVLVSADDRFSPTRLPPRVQETLRCLLEGDGEKQAAARMGLSRETVHQYVKALYCHYQVSSRAELLARVLRRTSPGG